MILTMQNALANMIDSQLLPNEVNDAAVLAAIASVRREDFVPKAFQGVAYVDDNIPLPQGRVIMKPLVFARLLQLAGITKSDKILHIGAATGFGCAVLSRLGAQVIAIECQPDLAEDARRNLRNTGIGVEVFSSSLTIGYPLVAPYDVIFIEGAVQQIPSGMTDQLREGGRLVAVQNIQQRVDARCGLGKAMLLVKREGVVHKVLGFDASVPLLPGFELREEFVF